MPVIYAASGNCHVYVDASADLDDAPTRSSSTPRRSGPGVCNAAETLLVHADVADAFLPGALRALADAGVELRGDERDRARWPAASRSGAATDEDYAQEFLALVLAVRVVDSVGGGDRARQRPTAPGTPRRSSPARSARRGRSSSASTPPCVYVNASTRFTDGGEFGMGAEIGNSTQKLHARGPIGLRELCTFKYLVEGTGQVRA